MGMHEQEGGEKERLRAIQLKQKRTNVTIYSTMNNVFGNQLREKRKGETRLISSLVCMNRREI